MNKIVWFGVLPIIILGIVFTAFAFVNFEPTTPYIKESDSLQENVNEQTDSNEEIIVQTDTVFNEENSILDGKFSLEELSTHSSEQDCFVGYKEKVYDLTDWLKKHPGGSKAISRFCGTSSEFQEAFLKKHGVSKSDIFMKVAVYKGDLDGN